MGETFRPEKDKVTEEWRRLHNVELYDLYFSTSTLWLIKSGRMGWIGHVAGLGESRFSYRVLVERQEGKRPLGRTRRSWENNVKMGLQDVGWGGMDWIDLA